MKIDVFQESIGHTISEYLVSFEYLTRLLGNYGFVPVPKPELALMNFEESQGSFDSLFINMEKEKGSEDFFGKAAQMSVEEKNVSFLNRYFIFKKTTTIPESTLKNMMDILGEEKNVDVREEEKAAEKVAEKVAETAKKLKKRIVLDEEESEEEIVG
jgi:hypothetical protein